MGGRKITDSIPVKEMIKAVREPSKYTVMEEVGKRLRKKCYLKKNRGD